VRTAADEEACRYVVAAPSDMPGRSVSLCTAALLSSCAAAVAAVATATAFAIGGGTGPPPPPAMLAAAPSPPPEASGLARECLWAELSAQEVRAVANFAAAELGCATSYKGAGATALQGCFLSGSEAVTLRLPAKSDALAHLDRGLPAPPRMAEVIVVHGEKPISEGVGIYTVGPLDGKSGLVKNAKITLTRSLHFNRRPVDLSDTSGDVVTTKVIRQLKNLLIESFGPIFAYIPEAFAPKDAGQLFVLYSPAVTSTLDRRISRVVFNWFKKPELFEINWMHPLPFTFDVIHEGRPDEWVAANIMYCGQMFATLPEIVAEADAGRLHRCSSGLDTAYAWDVAGPDPGTTAAADVAPPMHPRVPQTWRASSRGSVEWGDWQLLATVRPGSGLALYDVRWRGERLLYELAMSEAHAYYASARPEKQFHYSDKAFSLAQLSGNMVPGLDCPPGASFLEVATWMLPSGAAGITSDPASARPLRLACVYESNGWEGSLWRHAQLNSRKVAGRALTSLVVRSVSTVGNYDYISEVRLGEDGSIRVRNEFAGYPETDHTAPYRDPPARGRRIGESLHPSEPLDWGSRVRGDLVAQLHSHFCAWKVDLDILGERNEFRRVAATTLSGTGGTMTRKMQREFRVDHEDPDTPLVASAQAPGLWRVVNPEALNPSTGIPRGYAVMIESAPAVQTLPSDHPFSITGSFARRHLAVARHKDDEPHATHSLDHYPLDSPLLSVDRFLSDRESLVGEDLVCWIGVGKEHITRSEDVPLISNFGVQFALLPWNYHEENPAMQLSMIQSPGI